MNMSLGVIIVIIFIIIIIIIITVIITISIFIVSIIDVLTMTSFSIVETEPSEIMLELIIFCRTLVHLLQTCFTGFISTGTAISLKNYY